MPARLCESCGWPLASGYFDDARHGVVVKGVFRYITPTQWALLSFFRRYPGQVVVMERLWGLLYADRSDPPTTNAVRCHICKLRRSIAGIPYEIRSRGACGYVFDLVKP